MERKLIIVKCVKGSKTFTEGQTYKGSIVCETEFLTQYKLEGDNGRNYIVNAERFERVHEVEDSLNEVDGFTVFGGSMVSVDSNWTHKVKEIVKSNGGRIVSNEVVITVEEDTNLLDGKLSVSYKDIYGYSSKWNENHGSINLKAYNEVKEALVSYSQSYALFINHKDDSLKTVTTLNQFEKCVENSVDMELDTLVIGGVDVTKELEDADEARQGELFDRFIKELTPPVKKRKANNATKSRKAEIKSKLSERGLKLGCYDPTVEKLSAKEFGKVLEAVLYGENGETVLKLNGRLMVATVEVVDGEVDFQINSKENYIFVRGQYAWEDLLEWEGIAE